ncbi:restriction endonuclease [Nitrospina gracilis]|uniref:restriction endonuclease n=1 Tax=Nitrospina gracilis TaxID=35801 RepID=UPI001F4029CB|nr:restriction endonuclease [Nitrospina gracilis]MCF8719106.1 hypothetical protein [Nitrospina gracilis Nb-211]
MEVKALFDILENFGPTSLVLIVGGGFLAVFLLVQTLGLLFFGRTNDKRELYEYENKENDPEEGESDEFEDEDMESSSSEPVVSRMERHRFGEKLELAVGNFLEKKDWKVYYAGIEKGINDGGIDLIAKRDGTTVLIQCKFWKSHKIIYEKHINQFHGAIDKYRWDNPEEQVRGAFYTTARFSPEARRAAQIHEIELNESYRF